MMMTLNDDDGGGGAYDDAAEKLEQNCKYKNSNRQEILRTTEWYTEEPCNLLNSRCQGLTDVSQGRMQMHVLFEHIYIYIYTYTYIYIFLF